MPNKKYYIGRRNNPQLAKPYFVAYGQLSKADVKRKENAIYGSMILTPYDTQELYDQQIAALMAAGFSVR